MASQELGVFFLQMWVRCGCMEVYGERLMDREHSRKLANYSMI